MRTLIRNATVVDGTGGPVRERASVIVEDHLIAGVVDRPAPYYDRADRIIDARDGYVLPGVLNHHVHGLTRGPLMISGEPPLTDERVRTNGEILLRQGVTRACNVDGFALVEEAVAASRFPGLTVLVSVLQTPKHYEWTVDGPFPLGGIGPRHHTTLDEQLRRGAVAIGEIGPGVDAHWADYTLIPLAFRRELGISLSRDQARELRLLSEAGDTEGLRATLTAAGAPAEYAERFTAVVAETVRWQAQAETACREGLAAADDHPGVPVILHHTPGTYELALEAAEHLGPRLIAAHSNFQIQDPELAVAHARALKERGATVDIMSGDAWGGREFHPTPDVTLALLASGCVDLISTDYAGGFWDPMLLVVEKAAQAGVLALEAGVRMVTGAVADALPAMAPQRGTLVEGQVADIAVSAPGALSDIRNVLVSGIPVPLPQ